MLRTSREAKLFFKSLVALYFSRGFSTFLFIGSKSLFSVRIWNLENIIKASWTLLVLKHYFASATGWNNHWTCDPKGLVYTLQTRIAGWMSFLEIHLHEVSKHRVNQMLHRCRCSFPVAIIMVSAAEKHAVTFGLNGQVSKAQCNYHHTFMGCSSEKKSPVVHL